MAIYLDHVKDTWIEILSSTSLLPLHVDTITVQHLEGLAPKYSERDRASITDLMRQGALFPSVQDEHIRDQLLENLFRLPCIIPSLWTFFELLKYIQPICEVLRELLGAQMGTTIRSSFMSLYFQPPRLIVQDSETHDREVIKLLSEEEAWSTLR